MTAHTDPDSGITYPFGLTVKQGRYCHAYVANGCNAADAARAAGYDGKNHSVIGSAMRKNERVMRYIALVTAESVAKSDGKIGSPDEVMAQVWHEARTAKSDSARASNLKTLALFHGLLLERSRDETLEGRSSEELLEELARLRREAAREGIAPALQLVSDDERKTG